MTSEEYLNRVRALMPAIRERAPYMEQLRRLPDETLKEFQEAGLFRAIQPRRMGMSWIRGVFSGRDGDRHCLRLKCLDTHRRRGTIGSSGCFPHRPRRMSGTRIRAPRSPRPWRQPGQSNVSMGLPAARALVVSSGCDFCQWAVLGGAVPRRRRMRRPMCVFSRAAQ